MTKILLVEDDQGLGYILKEYLELHNYEVVWAKDGLEGTTAFRKRAFDLCILDVMLPHKNGFELAKIIKQQDSLMPLIFLTAKALKVDKLKGFKIGCDDYIVKPVDEEELIARIEAIIKRTRRTPFHIAEKAVFTIGKYQFDYGNQSLSLGNERQMITQKEAEVLKLLCLNQNRILDRKATLKQIWGESDYFKRRSMDVFISRLRKYLSQDSAIKITNVHGKGFILTVDG